MKRVAILLILALAVTSPALFAQSADQTTTTTVSNANQGTVDQTTTTTRTRYDNDSDRGDRGEVGVFADYLRLKHANLNQYGVGGRLGFRVHPVVQFELEGAYDFRQSRTASVTDVNTGLTTTYRANLRTLSFLVGPKFHNNGPFQVFATVKGGLLNFNVSTPSAPLGFTGTLGTLKNGDNNGVVYPAGGVEFFAKWFGIRAEVGDLIYFDRGANNNLRVTVGPVIRF